VRGHKGGSKWFDDIVSLKLSPKQFAKLGKSKKKFAIPDDWEWGGDHFHIARKMSAKEYDYLRSLPLTIHIPSLHTFLVHAGILPINPLKSVHHKSQPLSHLPVGRPRWQRQNDDKLRTEQELSILLDIPQNEKPWTLLNMRSITKRGRISRKANVGTPWAEVWNSVQDLCGGFHTRRDLTSRDADEDGEEGEIVPQESEDLRKKRLPCHPTTVVYGHAASRDLDIKRWSTGIDTGCVYGRRLTALIIGDPKSKAPDDPGGQEELEELRFGDTLKARLVSVKCPSPKV